LIRVTLRYVKGWISARPLSLISFSGLASVQYRQIYLYFRSHLSILGASPLPPAERWLLSGDPTLGTSPVGPLKLTPFSMMCVIRIRVIIFWSGIIRIRVIINFLIKNPCNKNPCNKNPCNRNNFWSGIIFDPCNKNKIL